MPKYQFLLFDACIIIGAHELGVWASLIQQCAVTITSTVKDQETYFWTDEQKIGHEIDLNKDVDAEKINCVDVPLSQVKDFRSKFGPTYLDRMDAGEAELLAFLFFSQEDWSIASADSHVFKVLGSLGLGERGISLEEILQKIGLGRNVDWKYSMEFQKKYTMKGEQDGITGLGLKSNLTKS